MAQEGKTAAEINAALAARGINVWISSASSTLLDFQRRGLQQVALLPRQTSSPLCPSASASLCRPGCNLTAGCAGSTDLLPSLCCRSSCPQMAGPCVTDPLSHSLPCGSIGTGHSRLAACLQYGSRNRKAGRSHCGHMTQSCMKQAHFICERKTVQTHRESFECTNH